MAGGIAGVLRHFIGRPSSGASGRAGSGGGGVSPAVPRDMETGHGGVETGHASETGAETAQNGGEQAAAAQNGGHCSAPGTGDLRGPEAGLGQDKVK